MAQLNPESWVTLDVGGRTYGTTLETLTSGGGYLARRFAPDSPFSRESPTSRGCFTIDRDGDAFAYVLDWLRVGEEDFVPPADERVSKLVCREAIFYGLPALAEACEWRGPMLLLSGLPEVLSDVELFNSLASHGVAAVVAVRVLRDHKRGGVCEGRAIIAFAAPALSSRARALINDKPLRIGGGSEPVDARWMSHPSVSKYDREEGEIMGLELAGMGPPAAQQRAAQLAASVHEE